MSPPPSKILENSALSPSSARPIAAAIKSNAPSIAPSELVYSFGARFTGFPVAAGAVVPPVLVLPEPVLSVSFFPPLPPVPPEPPEPPEDLDVSESLVILSNPSTSRFFASDAALLAASLAFPMESPASFDLSAASSALSARSFPASAAPSVASAVSSTASVRSVSGSIPKNRLTALMARPMAPITRSNSPKTTSRIGSSTFKTP